MCNTEQIADFACSISRATTQDIVDGFLVVAIAAEPLADWPGYVVGGLVHLAGEHQRPNEFLTTVAQQLLSECQKERRVLYKAS